MTEEQAAAAWAQLKAWRIDNPFSSSWFATEIAHPSDRSATS